MGFFENMKEKLFPKEEAPKREDQPAGVWGAVTLACRWLYRLRSIVLAIPVAVTAIILAIRNTIELPALVGINLQATGEYAQMVDRGVAVFCPLLLTGVCLLLMFLSKRVIYPWLISLFSLVVPYLIWITNIFPA